MRKKIFLLYMLLPFLLNLINCGDGKKGIKAYPGPDLSSEKVAFIDLYSPSSNFKGKFPPGRFIIYVSGKSYEIGLRQVLRIKSRKLFVEIEGKVMDQIYLEVSKGFSPRIKKYTTYKTTYSGKRVFYPDKKVKLRFVSEPGRKYKCKFRLYKGNDENEGFTVECSIIDKRTKKTVSNIAEIKYS